MPKGKNSTPTRIITYMPKMSNQQTKNSFRQNGVRSKCPLAAGLQGLNCFVCVTGVCVGGSAPGCGKAMLGGLPTEP